MLGVDCHVQLTIFRHIPKRGRTGFFYPLLTSYLFLPNLNTYCRSKGLAICHHSNSADATPLTAFSLTGCGDGIMPPLDGSEWGKLASGVGGSLFSAADDQQLAAAFDKGIAHFDCRY